MLNKAWREIANDIAGRIENGELVPGERISSEEEIASSLQVSRHTAHRALNELQKLGLVTRQRRWGTVVADRTRTKKRQIAYLVDFAVSRFEADVMMHIEHALPDGDRLVVSTSKNDPEREAENLEKLRNEVDGIICYPADGDANAEAFRRLADSGYPLVLVDRAPRGCEDLVVLTDNQTASATAVRHLIAQGHRRIAFYGSNNDQAQSVRERYLGYREAVLGLGYPTRQYERWIPLALDEYSEATFQSVSDAFTAMRCLKEPPTAAFCVQDRLAVGLIEACSQHRLEIGVDFGIATYNDYGPMFLRQHWHIDRIVQQVDQISLTAVARLNALMQGEKPGPGPVRIPAQFVLSEESEGFPKSSAASPEGAATV
ncbi:MAG TPA: substrate-binding domain-containing protein [Fimbriimonas sp.]